MKCFVGIDQGGSKTEIIINDEKGKLIDKCSGAGYSSFLNELHDSSEFTVRYIEQQIKYLEDALHKNNLSIHDVYAMTACMATVNSEDIRIYYEEELRKKTSIKNISVYNDMYGAWRAGTGKRPSGVLAVGTGTGIMLFDENGTAIDLSGNIKYQAAKHLGYRAFLHACFSAMRLLEPTILSEEICEFSQSSTLEEALKKTKNGTDIGALAYQYFVAYVYDAVLQKDRVAEDFVNQVGIGFAECIRDGIKKLKWENKEIPFVLNGGSFKGKGYVLERVIKANLSDISNLKLFQSEYEPVFGALLLCFEKYSDQTISNISKEDTIKFNLNRQL